MKPANAHPSFRLWISSYPSSSFPVSILQSAVKLTTESPDGLRQNILDSYLKEPVSDEKFFVSCKKAAQLKALTFGLAFFHALVQERRQFGPLGWNIPYGWNDSDFRISARQLHMFIDESSGLYMHACTRSVHARARTQQLARHPKLTCTRSSFHFFFSSLFASPGGAAASAEDNAANIPYKALNYIIGEVNYGGRVTDDWDRRTLVALLSHFITPAIHTPGYALSASGLYVVPPEGPYQSYVDCIKQFPLQGAPELFGLHANADISKEQAQTSALFAAILLTEAGSGAANEANRQRLLDELASDILRKLPPRFDIAAIQAKYPVSYLESMNTVVVQECIRFNKLTDVIRASLVNLVKALNGQVVMSREVELLAAAMFDGHVPEMWAAVSYPSLKPLAGYVADLVARLNFLAGWVDKGTPAIVHLPSIYFTQSYLTAILVRAALLCTTQHGTGLRVTCRTPLASNSDLRLCLFVLFFFLFLFFSVFLFFSFPAKLRSPHACCHRRRDLRLRVPGPSEAGRRAGAAGVGRLRARTVPRGREMGLHQQQTGRVQPQGALHARARHMAQTVQERRTARR